MMENINDDRLWYEVQIDYPAPINDNFYIMLRATEEEAEELSQYESLITIENGHYVEVTNRDMWLEDKYTDMLYAICGFAAQTTYRYSMDSDFDNNDECASIKNVIKAAKELLTNSPNVPVTTKFQLERKLEWLANYKNESAEMVKDTLQNLFFDMTFLCIGSFCPDGYDEPDCAYYQLDMK